MTGAPPLVPPPVVVTPLRIEAISLTNFRAFPGPSAACFELEGKNLLVYGENGAGKSSLFYALTHFFSKSPGSIATHNNVFSGQAVDACKVAIKFVNDPKAVEWSTHYHPCVYDFNKPVNDYYDYFFAGSDQRITQAASRAACLDYKSLLNTNFGHGTGAVNLFNVAVEHLLHDYPVSHGGQASTLGALWESVTRAIPDKHTPAAIAKMNQACVDFNTAFQPALQVLLPKINVLLQALGWPEVVLAALRSPGLTYESAQLKRDRRISGQTLTPEVTYRGHSPHSHQTFLNEARLSALGLAIYLAGRLTCTPTTTPAALKLLVLDDVLIGLDHSNRLPVLDLLNDQFADWQIVLLTHDRNWFDLARHRLPSTEWVCYEVYEGDAEAVAPMPIVRRTENRPAKALLAKGRELLTLGYVEAAANYTRQAFEYGLRGGCEFQRVQLNYKLDSTDHKAQDLLDALKIAQKPKNVVQADWTSCLHKIEMFKNVVMNPYSHPSAPNIPRQEVVDAADAVDKFLELAGKK